VDFLSVVVPAYNEKGRIAATLQSIAAYLTPQPYRWEILVVNDGSRDDTAAQVSRLQGFIPQLALLGYDHNQGKGAAIRTGLLAAHGKAILFCDADGATSMEELGKLLPHLERGAHFVVGSRRLRDSQVVFKQPPLRRFMSNAYPWLCRFLVQPGVRDVTCGFKLISQGAARTIASRMRITRWSFDAEMFTIARLHRIPVAEVPIRWADQGKSKVHLARDAWSSFLELLQIRRNLRRGLYR
jgi:dolichyl-phosphate beta-glucosyltransferase